MRHSNVAVVLPSMIGGGAEHVAVDLANHWSAQSRTVTVVTIDRGDDSRYPLSEQVHRIGLDLMSQSRSPWSAIRKNRQRIRKLRQAIVQTAASAVVSFTDITNITTLLACRGTGLRVIVCERTDPRHHQIGRVWQWLRQKSYRQASVIVVQTASVCGWAQSCGWQRPIAVIPNAAPRWSNARSKTQPERSPPTIVGLGRLSEEKGFHHLVEAFGRVASRFPAWQLLVYGEGSERPRLEQQVQDSQLAGRVRFPGWANDVETALQSAQIFVLPSRYEGFPNALLEAMTAGLACISFDCESGPREIIRHGVDGWLVPPGDIQGLADAIAQFMDDEPLRLRLSAAARDVATRFNRDRVYRQWDALLDGENC